MQGRQLLWFRFVSPFCGLYFICYGLCVWYCLSVMPLYGFVRWYALVLFGIRWQTCVPFVRLLYCG